MSEQSKHDAPNPLIPEDNIKKFNVEDAEDIDLFREPHIYEAFKSLLTQLKPHLENGEYSTFIGDDKSGRIPTLVVRRIAQKVYERMGKPAPQTIFYNTPANRELRETSSIEAANSFRDTLRKIKSEDPSKKVLILTDIIVGGDHVTNLSSLVREEGLDYDIATVSLTSTMTQERLVRMERNNNLLPSNSKLFIGFPYSVGGFASPAATGLVEDPSIAPSKGTPESEKRRVIRGKYTEPWNEEIYKGYTTPVTLKKFSANQYRKVRGDVKRLSDELYATIFEPISIDALLKTVRRFFSRR